MAPPTPQGVEESAKHIIQSVIALTSPTIMDFVNSGKVKYVGLTVIVDENPANHVTKAFLKSVPETAGEEEISKINSERNVAVLLATTHFAKTQALYGQRVIKAINEASE